MNEGELRERLAALERRCAEEYGEFALFALLKREDSVGLWDLVVSAPWFENARQDKKPRTHRGQAPDEPERREFFERLKRELGPEGLIALSRVVILKPGENFVERMHEIAEIQHGDVRLPRTTINGIEFERGFVFTSRRLAPTGQESIAA